MPKTKIMGIKDPVKRLFEFACERHSIWVQREQKQKPPWTDDPILRDYRFTNVFRELDRVTIWIHEHWLYPHAKAEDLWFAICVARLLNLPDCLQELGAPLSWNHKRFVRVLNERKKRGDRVFNAAYIVSTNGIAQDKIEYLAESVLDSLWINRKFLRPKNGDSLGGWHMVLGQMQGFGSFMTAQVIADMKHVEPLKQAVDWNTFAASGPGSRRGLNYVLGRERKAPWTEDDWRLALLRLYNEIRPMFQEKGLPDLDAQNLQNLLCEWSKYWRAATEGKMPKQKYRWQ